MNNIFESVTIKKHNKMNILPQKLTWLMLSIYSKEKKLQL